MKRRTVLIYISLGSVTSYLPIATAQTENISAKIMNVKQFGTLVSGITNNPRTIAANTATIQAAIDAVGNQGGGSVYIPAGLYQVAPPDLTAQNPASITINYDNIALVGDGIGKTIIQSRGDWSVINRKVVRGHALMIKGGDTPAQTRKNITIKNLELSGGINGFTGNNSFPANINTGDGWDLTHKGIVLDFDKYLDNIAIDSVYVHDFRGEVIYAGGSGIGNVMISNTRLHSSNASILSMEANLTVTNCEFSQTATAWVENSPVSSNKSYFFYKCIFKDSINQGFVLAQGNYSEFHKQTITGCSFYNSPTGICLFGGVKDSMINDNKFVDCGMAFITSGQNSNIVFFQNEIQSVNKPCMLANVFGQISNLSIKQNNHNNAQNLDKVACVFYLGDLQNIVIEDNVFENCRTPEQAAELTNERPLFRSNQYINVERRELQGVSNFFNQPPYIIEPKFEEVIVINSTGNSVIEASMSTDFYVDGQEVLLAGGSSNARIKFPQNCNTIQCQTDKYLSGTEKFRLRFQKSDRKWYEITG